MTHHNTATKLLDAAEKLFAAQGFAETTLRAITQRAGVNLAAVNYHFGSKEVLIQVVFQRFLDPFSEALTNQLDQLGEHTEQVTLEWLLGVLGALAVGGTEKEQQRALIFFRLAGLAYTQSQNHLRQFFEMRYAPLFQRFLTLLCNAVPEVPPMELFLRSHFALGSVIFTLQGFSSMQQISAKDFAEELGLNQVIQRLLPFVVAGVRAPYEAL